MKILLIFLIFLLVGYSCKNAKNVNSSVIATFNLEKLPDVTSLKLSDLGFVDVEYISLETKESSFFSWSNSPLAKGKLLVGDGFYLVKRDNNIFIFNENGLFERKIGTVGRGPDEFTVAHDVQVDDKNQEIYLLAGWQKKFFIYSFGGELIRTFKIPFFCSEFIFVENGILCFSENHMGNIEKSYNLIDTNGKILKSFTNEYPFHFNDGYVIRYENLFYHFNKQAFKKEVYSDTIYSFLNSDFKPHHVINVGDKLMTPNARSQFDGLYLGKNYIIPLNLFEFGTYVYYEFIYKFDFSNAEIYSFIGSVKKDFHILINTEQGITNDIDGGPNILPQTSRNDNTIIALVDALQFKKHIASETFKKSKPKYPEKKKELMKFAESLKETDNPVLVLVMLDN
jgi:hypothetical protein